MGSAPISLELALASFGRRIAVAAGALVALVSLLVEVPVWVASLRGGLTTISVLLVVRLGGRVLGRLRADPAPEAPSAAGSSSPERDAA